MIKNKFQNALVLVFALITTHSFSQLKDYNYKAEINNVKDTWHVLKLPQQSFALMKCNYAAIRIYGLSETDTIEIPYIIETLSDKQIYSKVPVTVVNRTKTEKGIYFTLQNDGSGNINEIELNFKEENFDWIAKVEGSNDNNEWFTISEKERLVALKREDVDFKATTIKFPLVNYKFIRIHLQETQEANLTEALIFEKEVIKGEEQVYEVQSQKIVQEKNTKRTIVSVHLKDSVPVSKIMIPVDSEMDYYRRVHLKTVKDSIIIENHTRYNYESLGTYEISSYKENEIYMENVCVDNLIIEIENMDNLPVPVGEIKVSGNPVQLKARFPAEKLQYILAIGNYRAHTPQYDIAGFKNNIPESPALLTVGNFKDIVKEGEIKKNPVLPFPKYVLWIILIAVIVILGFFTSKMLKK